jgi:hypothetical protein
VNYYLIEIYTAALREHERQGDDEADARKQRLEVLWKKMTAGERVLAEKALFKLIAYTLYFDKEGMGPTVLELVPYDFEEDRERFPKMKPSFGLHFKLSKGAGAFNLNNAPIGAGFFWSGRQGVEKLHAALGAWLDKTKPQ